MRMGLAIEGYNTTVHSRVDRPMTAGTIFLMCREQIDEYGIGNGIASSSWPASSRASRGDAEPAVQRGKTEASVFTWAAAAPVATSVWRSGRAVILFRRRGRRGHASRRASAASRRSPAKHVRGRRSTAVRAVPAAARQPGRRHAGDLRQQSAADPMFLSAGWRSSCSGTAYVIEQSFQRQGYIYNIFYIC